MSELSAIEKINKDLPGIIGNSSEIYIIGHKIADFDSVGASLGLARLCQEYIDADKVFIVINDRDENLEPGLRKVKCEAKKITI